jgi:hypothetical protein
MNKIETFYISCLCLSGSRLAIVNIRRGIMWHIWVGLDAAMSQSFLFLARRPDKVICSLLADETGIANAS